MAFKAAYTTAAEVPEHLRDEFKESSDNVWRPDVEAVDGWALEDVTGLKSALEKKTGELRTVTRSGKSAEAERDALQSQLDASKDTASGNNVEQKIVDVKRQLGETHAVEIGKHSETISTLTKQLEGALIEQAAIAAITNKDIRGNPVLLLPTIRAMSKLVTTDDGTASVEIVDPKTGNPRMNDAADPMSYSELLKEMREDSNYAAAFEGTGASGGGLPPKSDGMSASGNYTDKQIADMPQSEYAKLREEGKIT